MPPRIGRHSCKRTVPVGNVLVGNTRCNVEHDDTTLSVNVVSISETTELLLTSCVPNVEDDLPEVLQKISDPLFCFAVAREDVPW